MAAPAAEQATMCTCNVTLPFVLRLKHAQTCWQVLLSPFEDGIPLSTRIERLKAMKRRALFQKKDAAKALKCSQRTMKKVQKALAKLSDGDLRHAITQRAAAKAKAAPKTAAKTAANPP